MAYHDKAFYLSSNKYSSVTAWATNVAKNVGDIVKQTAPTQGNERTFVCVVAGTTNATTEPTWVITRGGKTTDNTVTWQECTGAAALNGDLTNCPNWNTVKGLAVSIGEVITNVAGTITLICDTAGTAGSGAEPSWSTTDGNTTADNTVTWRTLKHASAKFSNWAAPCRYSTNLWSGSFSGWAQSVAAQFIFVGNSHADAGTGSATLTSSSATATAQHDVICVNEAGSVPPVAGDITTGGVFASTSGNITVAFWARFNGITFKNGVGGSANTSLQFQGNVDMLFTNCRMEVSTTGASAFIALNGNASCILYNVTFKFAAAGQTIQPGFRADLTNCSVDGGGTIPTNLFTQTTAGYSLWCRNCDWSNITTTLVKNSGAGGFSVLFEDCKVNASLTNFMDRTSTTLNDMFGFFNRCDNGATNYKMVLVGYAGTLTTKTDVVRSGGAKAPDNQAFSWQVVTTANIVPGLHSSFQCPKQIEWNATTGSTITVNIYGIANAAAMPTNLDIFANVDYLGTSGNPLGVRVTSAPSLTDFSAFQTPSNLTADTSAWDSGATARQNSHTYSAGDIIAVASNPGRVFFCTVGGLSAGSEPGGYAGAVDGGTVTDNAATFRAGWRFKIPVTTGTVQSAGFINAIVHMTKASLTAYIDPRLA